MDAHNLTRQDHDIYIPYPGLLGSPVGIPDYSRRQCEMVEISWGGRISRRTSVRTFWRSVNFRRNTDPLLDARARACRMHGQSCVACLKCLTPLGRCPLSIWQSWWMDICRQGLLRAVSLLRRSVEFGEKKVQLLRTWIMLRRKHWTRIRY